MLFAQQDADPIIQFTLAPLFEDHGIPLAIMGVLVVFSALLLVILFITLLPHVLSWIGAIPAEKEEPTPIVTGKDELPEETLVVIAAAVAATLSRPHRIVRVGGQEVDMGWSLQGRMQHHQSHRLQQRDAR